MLCMRRQLLLLIVLASLLGGEILAAASGINSMFPGEKFDPRVTSPEKVLGFPLASKPASAAQVLRVAEALARTSNRVEFRRHGATHQERPLVHFLISSPQNLKRLEQIRAGYALLADPRKTTPARIEQLCGELPACAYFGYAIHGDELSSTDAALAAAYRLAASTSKEIETLLNNLVIIIDPLMNPDGRTRFLNQLAVATGYVPNLDFQSLAHQGFWPWGRGNHYLFDMNRDWLAGLQPETRGRQELMLHWHPQLVVDCHEMGPFETYLFNPPREPINLYISNEIRSWWLKFCADQAAAFDRHGWSYYTRDWYEFWYPGYTHAWAAHQGAIGILYEQAGVDGKPLRRPDGTVLTYFESVQHHVVSTFANLKTLAENRSAVLRDFAAQRLEAVRAARAGRHKTLIVVPDRNEARNRLFLQTLLQHGIEVAEAGEPFTLKNVWSWEGTSFTKKRFPKGSLIVRTAQPQGMLVLALLDWEQKFSDQFLKEERKELVKHRRSKIYDVTGWALPLLYDVEAYWSSSTPEVSSQLCRPPARRSGEYKKPGRYGAVIDGTSDDVYKIAAELLQQKVVLRVAEKAFSLGGRSFPRGSLLVRNHENKPDIHKTLKQAARKTGVSVFPVDTALTAGEGPDLGAGRFRLARCPYVAIAAGEPVSTTSFGSLWYVLDAELRLAVSPVSIRALGRLDLRQYNVLILPSLREVGKAQSVLAPFAGKLRTWVRSGGTLIAVGASAGALTRKLFALTSVRLRGDVLQELDAYKRALQLERGEPFPDKIQSEKKEPLQVLQERDRYLRLFSPHGAILRTEVDPESWLTFGCRTPLPVLMSGSLVFLARHPAAAPVRFASAKKMLLCGHLWPEAAQRLSGSAYLARERCGNGQVILFAGNPAFRAYLRGALRLFFNAVLFGPGLGTSQPVPR